MKDSGIIELYQEDARRTLCFLLNQVLIRPIVVTELCVHFLRWISPNLINLDTRIHILIDYHYGRVKRCVSENSHFLEQESIPASVLLYAPALPPLHSVPAIVS